MAAIAASSVDQPADSMKLASQCGRWSLFACEETKKSFFGLIKKKTTYVSVLDREGVVRFKKGNVHFAKVTKAQFGAGCKILMTIRSTPTRTPRYRRYSSLSGEDA